MSSTPPAPIKAASEVRVSRVPSQLRDSVFNNVHTTAHNNVTHNGADTRDEGREHVNQNPSQYSHNTHPSELERGGDDLQRRHNILGRAESKKRSLKRKKSSKEQSTEKKRKEWPTCWIIFCYAVTFYAPPFILSTCGRMKRPEVQRAWREKIGLITIIILLCACVAFLTFGFTQVVCGVPPVRVRGGRVDSASAIINGFAYDLSKYQHPGVPNYDPPIPPDVLLPYAPINAGGQDLSFLFQKVNQKCQGIITLKPGADAPVQNGQVGWYFPCVMVNQDGSTQPTGSWDPPYPGAGCHTSALARSTYFRMKKSGEIFYTWDDINNPHRNLAVYNGFVLDLDRLKFLDSQQVNVPRIFQNLTNPANNFRKKDASLMFLNTGNKKVAECLTDVIKIGSIDTKTMGCIASDIVLYISLTFIVGVVVIKFVLAVIFGWCLSWRLGSFKPESYEERMKRAAEIELWSEDINTPAALPNRKSRYFPKTSRFSNNYPNGRASTLIPSSRPVSNFGAYNNGRRSPLSKPTGTPSSLLHPNGGTTPRISPNGSPGTSPTLRPSRSSSSVLTPVNPITDPNKNKSSSSLTATREEFPIANSLATGSRESLGNCPFPNANVVPQPSPDYQPWDFPLAHTICLVTAYSESEQGLRSTLDSVATTDYPNSHKLILVIADGIITGGGNTQSTPEILLSLMHEFVVPPEEVEPNSYVAIADGTKRHNMAKVYAGFYKYDDSIVEVSKQQRVPMVVVVKCGTPEEQNSTKPGNRGKRDSQIILMSFLQKVMFDERMTPFEYEFFNSIWRVTGVTPDKYEIVLMVDADTKVYPDSLSRMVSCMTRDYDIMGLCGETKIANKTDSFWTMIQVFEYYISHHQSKAFESIFGGVTCLPGCFCMYRIKAPKRDGFWVPILAAHDIVEHYSENIVDTLHKKNLYLLGEDRFLTTLMLRTFPKRKMIFVPQAVCKTIVPDSFKVLLSQRRRWINSTVHNLMELVLVRDLCGTFCFSMQFVIFMELVGTVVLPAAISFTVYLIVISFFIKPPPIIPLLLLAAILGLPAILILMTSRKIVYVGWMLIYLFSLPIWNFLLPVYAYWHFDDFTWGATRQVEGDKGKGDHSTKEGEFDSSKIVMKRWVEFERERRFKEAKAKGLPPPQFMDTGMLRKSQYSMAESYESMNTNESSMPLTSRSRDNVSNTELDSEEVSPTDFPEEIQEKDPFTYLKSTDDTGNKLEDNFLSDTIPVGLQQQAQQRIRQSVINSLPASPSPTNSSSSRQSRHRQDGGGSPRYGSPRRDTYYAQQTAREAAARQNNRDSILDQPPRPPFAQHDRSQRERRGSREHSRSSSIEIPTSAGPRHHSSNSSIDNSINKQSKRHHAPLQSQQQSEASTSILIPELLEENTNNIHEEEAPPSYEEALATSTAYSSFTIPPPDGPNASARYYSVQYIPSDLYSHTQHSFLAPVFVARNWLALIYLLLWDLSYACFCFSWVIGTLVTGVVLLIIPPVGYVLLLGMLARVELSILNSITDRATERAYLPSITHRLTSHTSQNAITHFFFLLSDEFTLRSILYFTTIKFAVSITFFTMSILNFVIVDMLFKDLMCQHLSPNNAIRTNFIRSSERARQWTKVCAKLLWQ
ncbi:13800_t:CDS:10 [Ambispora leptoticha]|uniref:chitin synthase n=1 Tax=Ambispora leptoticha TaxID=144679 RepID=A0A9N9FC59_9GLOM|nr:13800_t:CDS:10 [Ambispora leptoticha]